MTGMAWLLTLLLAACSGSPGGNDTETPPPPTPEPDAVISISITASTTLLGTGGTTQLTAELEVQGSPDPSIDWTTSDPLIASVDTGGSVTGIAPGEVTIRGTSLTSPTVYDEVTLRIATFGPATSDGPGAVDLGDLAPLPDGSLYVLGAFTGSEVTFGDHTLNPPEWFPDPGAFITNAFVAKLAPDGRWAWARLAGGLGSTASGATVLPDGSAIVTGTYEAEGTFGDHTLRSEGASDAFVARIAPDGTWMWARSVGGADEDFGMDGTRLTGGSILVAAYTYSDDFAIGGDVLPPADPRGSTILATISMDGDWGWVRTANVGSYGGSPITATKDGGALFAGYFTGSLTLGDRRLFADLGTTEAVVAKIDADGTWQWANQSDSSNETTATSVTVTPGGRTWISGYHDDAARFDDATLPALGSDSYVASLTPGGMWQSARGMPSTGTTDIPSIAPTSDGEIIVASAYGGTITLDDTTLADVGDESGLLIARTSPTTWRWARQVGTAEFMWNPRIVTWPNGSIAVAGSFRGSARFTGVEATSQEGDVYVLKLDPMGLPER